jgi:DNA-binding NarL/FixJ family response regulator
MISHGMAAAGRKPGGRITIVLADDHSVVRQGLRVLLEKEPDFDIVGEASNGLETLRCVEKLRPALVIVDLAMPQLNRLEVTREIAHQRLPTRVLLLSAAFERALCAKRAEEWRLRICPENFCRR